MKYIPHEYQKTAIKFLVSHGSAGLFLDPGLGKTSIVYAAFKVLKKQGMVDQMLVVAPLRPAHSVWPQEAVKWDDFAELKVVVLHGPKKAELLKEDADVFVINPEGLQWYFKTVKQLPEMLTIDECFPAGTKVMTETGSQTIESLRAGNKVQTSFGSQTVLKTSSRLTTTMVELKLQTGKILRCTPEHPVFTDLGWLPAHSVKGRQVYDPGGLSNLRYTVQNGSADHTAKRRAEMLLQVLRQETDVAHSASRISTEDGQNVCHSIHGQNFLEQGTALDRGVQSEEFGSSESSGTPTDYPWWERNWDDLVREVDTSTPSGKIFVELRNKIGWKAAWLSYLLQSRFWESTDEDSVGSGRAKSLSKKGAGREKGEEAVGTWVESVSHIKLGHPETVYNLEVEGCPNYFAEGFLVHNCTRFKHANTQRFKVLRPNLERFSRRYILTGSPAPNGLMDLFGQIYILDMGNALGRFITHFRANYFAPSGYGGFEWKPRPGAVEAIYECLKPLVLRMSGADYLSLPPLVNNTIKIHLPEKAQAVYQQMEDMLVVALKDDVIMAANAAAATNKCRQIANGGVYHDDGEKHSIVHEAKLDAVEELVEELSGKPAFVAYEFQHDLHRLRTRFPSAPFLGGGVTPKRQREVELMWNAGEIPVLLAQPQSVAHGLNLQGTGAAVIWHSLTWDLELYEQFIRRVWRQGQKERVVVHHLIAMGTVDEVIMKVLQGKDKTQRHLLDALKAHLNSDKLNSGLQH